MPGVRKRLWGSFPARGSCSPPPSPCKVPRLSPEPGPSRRSESPGDIILTLERFSNRGPRQLLSFFQTHNSQLARALGSPELSPRKVYTLLRVVRRLLEEPTEPQEVQSVLDLVLTPAFVLHSLLSFTANLEIFRCPDGQISQEVVGDTVAVLHHLLEAAPDQARTLLCYPLDLLCATVRRLQSRGFHFTWITQKQLQDTKGLLDVAFLQTGESGGNARGSLVSPASQDDFRLIPVFPTPEDIFLEPTGGLKPNIVSGRYKSSKQYLDTHFRLLREDLVKPLRDGISSRFTLRSLFSDSQRPASELRLYQNVQLANMGTSPAGAAVLAIFLGKRNSFLKCLLSGSLVCLISSDCSHILFGTVVGSQRKEVLQGAVWLDIRQSHTKLLRLLGQTTFTMVESPAFFESYRHVLEGLQEMDTTSLPFRKYLVKCSRDIDRPAYLEEEGAGLVTFDLSALHPPRDRLAMAVAFAATNIALAGGGSVDIPQAEVPLVDLTAVSPFCPQVWTTETFPHLDESQIAAIRVALSTEFVLIQGPPGTGKTFIGLKILKILLDNEALWNKGSTPCLVVCYTNHALDQFLEGILDFLPTGVVRVGGRSKSEKVTGTCSLRNLRKRQLPHLLMSGERQQFGWKMQALRQQKEHIAYSTEVLQLLQKGVLTERELQPEIASDHLWIPEGRMMQWLKVCPPQENRGQPPRRQDHSSRRRQGRRAEAGLPSQYDNAEFFQSHRDERFLDNDYDEVDDGNGRSSATPREKFAYIVPEEESARQNWLLSCLKERDTMASEEVAKLKDVRNLPLKDRWRLYRRWVAAYENQLKAALADQLAAYEKDAAELEELTFQEDLRILRQSQVIGMTTTGAAKYRKLLQSIRPRIVIVEEAAEILEAHILTSLTSSCQHLILIGDHQQLRPKPADYTLEKKYGLGISLFERMINNQLPHVQLLYQHRMRPEISQLLVPCFYKELRDHPVVLEYENIKGLEQSMFFVQHKEEESHSADSESYSNRHEAAFLVALTGYLLKQGYSQSQITILTPYHRQVVRVRALLHQKGMEKVAAHAVDDFQGEENDIVLLSLVRSNSQGKIGFLKDKNRLCVALSRAKKGFYCIGNLDALSANSRLWKEISGLLKMKGLLGEELTLLCQNHPETKTAVKESADFKSIPDGGCTLKCRIRLECGHPCMRHCHPCDRDHSLYNCQFPCSKVLCEQNHKCPKKCWERCGLCEVKVEKVIPKCGHKQMLPCHLPPEAWVCEQPCQELLECGHPCKLRCGQECKAAHCKERVQVALPCSHAAETECFRQKMPLLCQERCRRRLDCGHVCQGSCHECVKGRIHVACRKKCTRVLLCSHTCPGLCSENCPPCERKCLNWCPHSRCNKACGAFCFPCTQPCGWQCKHHQCSKMCWEVCNRPRCDEPCGKTLGCKHPCVGLCGEPCPPKCRVCHQDELAAIFFGNEDEPESRFVVLKECGHVFEVGGLDYWMDREPGGDDNAPAKHIQQKVCPKCLTPIQNNPRYNNVIKATRQRIEEVKQKIHGSQEQLQFSRAALLNELIVMPSASCHFEKEALRNKIMATTSLQSLRDWENTVRLLFCLQRLRNKAFQCTEERRRPLMEAAEAMGSWLCRRQSRDTFTAQQLRECRNEVKRLSYLANLFERLSICEKKGMPSSSASSEAVEEALLVLCKPEPFAESQEELLLPMLATVDELLPASGPQLSQAEKVSIAEAMRFARGQWYECPKGHLYSIGQCGRPVEMSQCPECGATIGGRNKRAYTGNAVAHLSVEPDNKGKEQDGRPLSSISDLVGPSELLLSSTSATYHPPGEPGSPPPTSGSAREASSSPWYSPISPPYCAPHSPPLSPCPPPEAEPEETSEGKGPVVSPTCPCGTQQEAAPSLEGSRAVAPSWEPPEYREADTPLSPHAGVESAVTQPLEMEDSDMEFQERQGCTTPGIGGPSESEGAEAEEGPFLQQAAEDAPQPFAECWREENFCQSQSVMAQDSDPGEEGEEGEEEEDSPPAQPVEWQPQDLPETNQTLPLPGRLSPPSTQAEKRAEPRRSLRLLVKQKPKLS